MIDHDLRAAHADWPRAGEALDLDIHDPPHASAGIEWWYQNIHLTTEDGAQYAAFAAFFRTAFCSVDDPEISYGHVAQWALIDVGNSRYVQDSTVDRTATRAIRDMVRADHVLDRDFARSLAASLDGEAVPLPDRPIAGPVTVEAARLSLDYGRDAHFSRESTGHCYRLRVHSPDERHGVDLRLTPHKPAILHGVDGIVQGTHEDNRDGMFYYFIPKCAVQGSITIDGQQKRVVSGTGWYDHEFGGCPRNRHQGLSRDETSWEWVGLHLDNGWNLTLSNLYDVDTGTGRCDLRERLGIAVSPDGERVVLDTARLDSADEWISARTYNSYPTRWRVRTANDDIDLTLACSFPEQEFRSLVAKRGFWEGRVDVVGVMNDEQVAGLGFVEVLPAQTLTDIERWLNVAADESRRQVRRFYPDPLTSTEACVMAGGDLAIEDLDCEELTRSLIRPVRHVVDAGGKAWRGFVALAAIELAGGDPNPHRCLLAAAELLQSGSLIVDDVQDESAVRRGAPAAHVVFGDAHAINAGSAAYFAFEHIVRTDLAISDAQRIALHEAYFDAMRAAHMGQALDIAGHWQSAEAALTKGDPDLLERRILTAHRLKTAVPARRLGQIGAVIGNAHPRLAHALCGFFEALGLAYQIVDDVLDLRPVGRAGVPALRKPPGDDLRSKKLTLPMAKAVRLLGDVDGRQLLHRIRNMVGTSQDVADCVRVIDGTGALDACLDQAHDLLTTGWAAVDSLLPPSMTKTTVEAFSWHLIQRGNADEHRTESSTHAALPAPV